MYPDNVAFPFGGEGNPQYVVMELHYDNPKERAGTTHEVIEFYLIRVGLRRI